MLRGGCGDRPARNGGLSQPPHTKFGEFVSAHADRIYNHAFRMLGNREDAEEAVQDIFLRAHRGLDAFRGESDVRTWLYRITANVCLTRLRRRRMLRDRTLTEGGSQLEDIVCDDPGPEDQLIKRDISEFVVKALESVSPADRSILILFHVDGLKYEEIAGILRAPVGTVCTKLYRARQRLRVELLRMLNEPTR